MLPALPPLRPSGSITVIRMTGQVERRRHLTNTGSRQIVMAGIGANRQPATSQPSFRSAPLRDLPASGEKARFADQPQIFPPKSDKGLDFPGTQSVHTQGLPRP